MLAIWKIFITNIQNGIPISKNVKMEKIIHFLVAFFFFCMTCVSAQAAGFNCKDRSLSNTEILICESSPLSILDDFLTSVYTDALSGSQEKLELINEQNNWIKTIRNACHTKYSCLKKSYENRIVVLKRKIAKKTCAAKEKKLIGLWRSAKNEYQDFEEMTLDIIENKHEFMSWLHDAPEMTGNWSLQDCKLEISHSDDPKNSFDYEITYFKDDLLEMDGLIYKKEKENTKVKTYLNKVLRK
jgi:uncharacterized protein